MARKPRQRKNGDGTIITFKSKGKIIGYAAEMTIGWDTDGKRQKVRSPRFKLRPDAEAALVKMRKQHEQGVKLDAKPQTFEEHLEEWIEGIALVHRPRTVVTYQWAIDKHIVPALGKEDVRHIRTPMLRKFFKALMRKKLAPKSIGLIRTVIRQALELLVEDDVFEYNPADRAKGPPSDKATTGKALTIDQIAALLEAARGERLDVALRLCFSFGLRRGEVCGLRWCDVDLENGILIVNGTLGYVGGQGLLWGPVKSESGQGRAYKLPQSLTAALQWLETRQEAERKAMGDKWAPVASEAVNYVFVAARTGGALNPGRLYDAFKRAAKIAGLEGFRPHDLRHSAASFLHVQRAPKKTISVFMGHASTRITDDIYTHLFQDELNEAADQIEQGLEAAIERRRKTGDSGL
jgi:integrase